MRGKPFESVEELLEHQYNDFIEIAEYLSFKDRLLRKKVIGTYSVSVALDNPENTYLILNVWDARREGAQYQVYVPRDGCTVNDVKEQFLGALEGVSKLERSLRKESMKPTLENIVPLSKITLLECKCENEPEE